MPGAKVRRADHDEWVEPGNSVIVDPDGVVLAGPARHEETILYADIDLAAVRAARRYFDPVGHYHRPDIFQLQVDTRARPPVVLQAAPASGWTAGAAHAGIAGSDDGP
jgi:nitrilase